MDMVLCPVVQATHLVQDEQKNHSDHFQKHFDMVINWKLLKTKMTVDKDKNKVTESA